MMQREPKFYPKETLNAPVKYKKDARSGNEGIAENQAVNQAEELTEFTPEDVASDQVEEHDFVYQLGSIRVPSRNITIGAAISTLGINIG
ncbi:unnamed protein product [Cochlearia groenlandica]